MITAFYSYIVTRDGLSPKDPNPEIESGHIGCLRPGPESGPVVPAEWLRPVRPDHSVKGKGGRRELHLPTTPYSMPPPSLMRPEVAETLVASMCYRVLGLTELPTPTHSPLAPSHMLPWEGGHRAPLCLFWGVCDMGAASNGHQYVGAIGRGSGMVASSMKARGFHPFCVQWWRAWRCFQ